MSELTKTYTVCDLCGERGEPFQPGSKFLRQQGQLVLAEAGVNYDGTVGRSSITLDLCEDCYSRVQAFLDETQRHFKVTQPRPVGQLKLRGIEDEDGNEILGDLTQRCAEDTIELFTAPTIVEEDDPPPPKPPKVELGRNCGTCKHGRGQASDFPCNQCGFKEGGQWAPNMTGYQLWEPREDQ